MSEQLNEIVEAVKSSVAETVETKAEKAEVEAVKAAVEAIEVPSVEGFAKSEEVASLVEKLEAEKAAREELQAKFDSAPAIHIKEEKNMSDIITFNNYEGFKGDVSIDLCQASSTSNSAAPVAVLLRSLVQQLQQLGSTTRCSSATPSVAFLQSCPRLAVQ